MQQRRKDNFCVNSLGFLQLYHSSLNKNDRAGNSKEIFLYRETENTGKKLSESALLKFGRYSKICNSQMNTHQKKKKANKTQQENLVTFQLTFSTSPLPRSSQFRSILKIAGHIPRRDSWFQRKQNGPHSQKFPVCFDLSRGSLKHFNRGFAFTSPNLEFLQRNSHIEDIPQNHKKSN